MKINKRPYAFSVHLLINPFSWCFKKQSFSSEYIIAHIVIIGCIGFSYSYRPELPDWISQIQSDIEAAQQSVNNQPV